MRGRESIEAQIRKAQRGSVAAPADDQVRRVVAQYMDRAMAQTMREFQVLKEKVEVMAAERGKQEDAAVRRKDLGMLLTMPKMKSQSVTSAPTTDQFNDLVHDVRMLHLQLASIGEALKRLPR